MAPFAHSLFTTMFGIGVYFALQQRNALAKAGCILLGYVGAVIMHGLWNGSSLLGIEAYFGVYVFWMVPIFGLAIVLGVRKPPQGAARRRRQTARHGRGGPGDPQRGDLAGLDPQPQARRSARRPGSAGKPAGKSVKTFAAQVVELAFVRDRIDRGFGDQRVFALLNEEAYGVYAARAAAPALQGAWPEYRATEPLGRLVRRRVPAAAVAHRRPPAARPAGRRCPSARAPASRPRRAPRAHLEQQLVVHLQQHA